MSGRDASIGREHALGHPALTDSQTGLANRLHFELVYSYLFRAGDRGMTFTVMLVSVGSSTLELTEPERLRTIGGVIHRTTRTADLVAHVGNARYVVLLLGTNLQGARIAADRLEMALERIAPGALSFGLAMFRPEMKHPSELLEAADGALVAAESRGGGIEVV